MLKLKIGLITVALCQMILNVKSEDSSNTWTAKIQNGRVVNIGKQLIYISAYNNTINLTSPDINFNFCQLNTSSESIIKNPIDVDTLGNGKIVVWTEHYDHWQLQKRLIFIVDPKICTAREIIWINDESKNSFGNINSILTYYNTFDVFSVTPKCAPCRYSDIGESIQLSDSLNIDENVYEGHSISLIEKNDPSKGYLSLLYFPNCSTTIEILNPKFEVMQQRLLNYSVSAHSTAYGNIRVCFLPLCEETDEPFTCEILDSELKSNVTIQMPEVGKGQNLRIPVIHNLPDGGAMATVINSEGCFLYGEGEGALAEVYIQRIHANGTIDSPIKSENVLCWDYGLQNLLLPNNKYCSIAFDGFNSLSRSQLVFFKCVDF